MEKATNTINHASFSCNLVLSLQILRWMKDLFRRGLKGPLDDEDIYQHRKVLDSERVTDKFGKLWEQERKRKNPSIIRVIVRAYGAVFIPLGVCYSVMESITKYVLYS